MVSDYTPLHITAIGTLVPVGLCVNTTSGTTITAGSNVTVTPASMAGIVPGLTLNFANGTGTAENVVVKTITSTTFTADFVNNHSGSYNITSLRGTFLGPIVVNSAGSGATLTLYNGSPNTLPKAGAAIAVIAIAAGQPLNFACTCDNGLFYTLAATSAPDLTLHYIDHSI